MLHNLINIKTSFTLTMKISTGWELIWGACKNNISKCKVLMRRLSKELINLKGREILVLFLPDMDKIMSLIPSKKTLLPSLESTQISKITPKQPGNHLSTNAWESLMTPWNNLLTKALTNRCNSTRKWLEIKILILFHWLNRKKRLRVKWKQGFQMLILRICKANIHH